MQKSGIYIVLIALLISLVGCEEETNHGDSGPDTYVPFNVENDVSKNRITELISGKRLYVYGYDTYGHLGNNKAFIMDISSDGAYADILDANNSEIVIDDTKLYVSDENNKSSIGFDVPDNINGNLFTFSIISYDESGIYVTKTLETLHIGNFSKAVAVNENNMEHKAPNDGSAFPYVLSYSDQNDSGKALLENYEKTLFFNITTLQSHTWYGIIYSFQTECAYSSYIFKESGLNVDDQNQNFSYSLEGNTIYYRDNYHTLVARDKHSLTFRTDILDDAGQKLFDSIEKANEFSEAMGIGSCGY